MATAAGITVRACAVMVLGIAGLTAAGCGSSDQAAAPDDQIWTSTRTAAAAVRAAETCPERSPSREHHVAFQNRLDVPVVITNTLEAGDCSGWSGSGNPSQVNGEVVEPGQTTRAYRFEVAGVCDTHDGRWTMTYALKDGGEIISTRTSYVPCRDDDAPFSYGFFFYQQGKWQRATTDFIPADPDVRAALGNRTVSLLGSIRSSSVNNPDVMYLLYPR